VGQPKISLYFMPCEVMLVLAHPTGVFYKNQVAGYACRQEELEGVLASVDFSDAQTERIMTFEYPNGGVDNGVADQLDQVLSSSSRSRFIRVDRSRVADSFEAWVYVVVETPPDEPPPGRGDYHGSIYGFGAAKGVLTWHNSD